MSFNWEELFGSELNGPKHEGTVKTVEALADKEAVAIYFSAHWCPPCRGFTPKLGENFNKLVEAGKKVQIVFASSDRDEGAMKEYHESMPFLALPYSEREKKESLAKKYGCNGIPYLVFLDGKTGETITTNGRGGISGADFIESFPYHPKPAYDIAASMDGIMDGISFMLIQDLADKDQQSFNSAVITEVAKEMKVNEDKTVSKWFWASGGGPVNFVKGECDIEVAVAPHNCPKGQELKDTEDARGWGCDGCGKAGHTLKGRKRCADCDFDYCGTCYDKSKEPISESAKVPVMILLNLKEKCFYKKSGVEINRDVILGFVEEFKNDKLEKKLLASEREEDAAPA